MELHQWTNWIISFNLLSKHQEIYLFLFCQIFSFCIDLMLLDHLLYFGHAHFQNLNFSSKNLLTTVPLFTTFLYYNVNFARFAKINVFLPTFSTELSATFLL